MMLATVRGVIVGWLVLGQAASATAAVVLDFDSISLAPGACTDASGYLGGYGITFSAVTAGATGIICNVAGSAITPVSGSNVFFGVPPVTNNDVSYDLLFSTPQMELSFSRATVDPGTSLPAWSAFAYDASDNLLDSVVQPSIFPGPPTALFTLSGPGITRLHIDAFNSARRTYNHPPIDNMVVTTVPDSGTTLMLLGGALMGLSLLRRKLGVHGR